jgi:hypothetical protein
MTQALSPVRGLLAGGAPTAVFPDPSLSVSFATVLGASGVTAGTSSRSICEAKSCTGGLLGSGGRGGGRDGGSSKSIGTNITASEASTAAPIKRFFSPSSITALLSAKG